MNVKTSSVSDVTDTDQSESEDDGNTLLLQLIETTVENILSNKKQALPVYIPTPKKHKTDIIVETPPFVPMNLTTLIALASQCEHSTYMDCEGLFFILEPLKRLDALIGMSMIKYDIVQFVLRYQQKEGLMTSGIDHILIYGSPGTGKSTVAQILADIISILKNNSQPIVVHASATTMISSFIGRTAIQTEAVIRSSFGGVLVIDEASSLADGRTSATADAFSKSALDTLNRMMTENTGEFTCILAGYEVELQRDILSINPGFGRRFNTVFRMESYTPQQLQSMFYVQLNARHLYLGKNVVVTIDLFHCVDLFKFMAGDVVILIDKIVSAHAMLVFGKIDKQTVSQVAVDMGIQQYKKTRPSEMKTHLLMYI